MTAGKTRVRDVEAAGREIRRELAPEGNEVDPEYREAVRERQSVHRGLTRGLLDVIDPKTKLAGFVPKDPYTAGCLIELRGPLAAASAEPASDAGEVTGA